MSSARKSGVKLYQRQAEIGRGGDQSKTPVCALDLNSFQARFRRELVDFVDAAYSGNRRSYLEAMADAVESVRVDLMRRADMEHKRG